MRPRRRLNLFAFMPETDALFGMLMIASIALALFLGVAFGAFFGISNPSSGIEITTRGLEATRAYLPVICLSGGAVSAVLCLACVLYFRHPSEIRRRRKIAPLSGKDQELQDQVDKLAIRTGLKQLEIEMPPQGLRGTDAQAFGVGKAHRIALDGGFRVLRKTKPDVFIALLHHELAHFANGDVGRSYLSDALWKSIRWMIILPFAIGFFGKIIIGLYLGVVYGDLLQRVIGPALVILKLLVQFSLVTVVTAAIWARLLRTREFYADWRAALWGSQGGLNKIFQEETETEIPKTRLTMLKLHPDAKDRMKVIQHPEALFKISPLLVFLAGVLLSFLFASLYFSLASILAFAGVFQAIRDASTGLLYWLARGILWLGIISVLLLVFGSISWFINGVLLPQIQKQVALELFEKQRGLIRYIKLLISATILVAGIEIGFAITPFGPFAPNDLWGVVVEIFIITPILAITAWWYLAYIKFISFRLFATQVGNIFSPWKSRFIKTASALWVLFFFIPGLFLTRYLSGELLEVFLYFSLIWLASTFLLSTVVFVASWAIIKLFFDNQPQKCPHCGKFTQQKVPAVGLCEHCEGVLGEWLFVPEKV